MSLLRHRAYNWNPVGYISNIKNNIQACQKTVFRTTTKTDKKRRLQVLQSIACYRLFSGRQTSMIGVQ